MDKLDLGLLTDDELQDLAQEVNAQLAMREKAKEEYHKLQQEMWEDLKMQGHDPVTP